MMKMLKNLIKIIITITLLLLLFFKLNMQVLFENILEIKIAYLTIPIFVFFFGIYLSILRWGKILRFYGISKKNVQLYSLYLKGAFYNNFLPSTIGGDGYKFYKLNKEFKEKKAVLSSILLERGFGFISLFIINLIFIFIMHKEIIENKSLLYIEAALIFATVLILSLFYLKINLQKIPILNKYKLFIKFLNLIESIKRIKTSTSLIFYAILVSTLFNMLTAFSLWALFFCLGINVNLFIIIFVSTITHIFAVVPISLNNIGVTEGLYVFLFSFFGISPEISLLASLIGRIISILSSSVGGIILMKEHLSA